MASLPTTVAGHAERMASGFTVSKPFGSGPFPVALQLHGCAGAQPFQKAYAAEAVKAGFAVVIVDSFGPRGMSRLDGSLLVCTGATLRGAQRAADLYDEEVDRAVTALTAMVEPCLIVVLAVGVGTVVIALFLPMIDLIRALSGG